MPANIQFPAHSAAIVRGLAHHASHPVLLHSLLFFLLLFIAHIKSSAAQRSEIPENQTLSVKDVELIHSLSLLELQELARLCGGSTLQSLEDEDHTRGYLLDYLLGLNDTPQRYDEF
jgi:hypothetical protein